MNIAFDIDGVLYPWQEVIYEFAVDMKWTKLDFWKFWVEESLHLRGIYWDFLVQTPIFYEKVAPIKEHLDLLNELSKNNTIYYITARPNVNNIFEITRKWLLPFPQSDNLIFAKDKGKYLDELNIDYILEDTPIKDYKGKCKLILMNQPNNQGLDYPRVYSVKEFIDGIS